MFYQGKIKDLNTVFWNILLISMENIEEPKQETVEEPVQPKEEVKKEPEIKKPGIFTKLKEKLNQYKRTLAVSQKPDKEEFLASAKITGIGILFIGFIGFIIFLIYNLLIK